MGLVSFVVFVVLQLLFIPLAIIGAVLVGYKQLAVSKRLDASQTGIEILNGRLTMDWFDIREDGATVALAKVLPNTSVVGLWLALFPLWVKYKISGKYFAYPRVAQEGAEGIADLVPARTLYFDRIIERRQGEMEQFVMMGAGYDTRAYGELNRGGLHFFELDQQGTQKVKREGLDKAGIDSAHVTFVEVDFSKESAFDRLVESGFDPAKKTLFLWEGVTLYLSEEDVRKTLRGMVGHSPPGSVVVADIYGERMLEMARGKATKKTLEYTSETLNFGLVFASEHQQNLAKFVESEGLTLGETFFLGEKSDKGSYAVVAELEV